MSKSGKAVRRYHFLGEYEYSIDAKGRVSLPQKLRKGLDLEQDRVFVITRGFDQSLLLYPFAQWENVEEKLSEFSYMGSADHRAFIRILLSWAEEVELDSQLRLNIPARHLSFSHIQKECVILGLMDKIELWNPSIYQAYRQDVTQNYEQIAGKIIGL